METSETAESPAKGTANVAVEHDTKANNVNLRPQRKRQGLWDKEARLRMASVSPQEYHHFEHGFYLKCQSEIRQRQLTGDAAIDEDDQAGEPKVVAPPIALLTFMTHRKPPRRSAYSFPPGLANTAIWLSELAHEFSLHKNLGHCHLNVLVHRLMDLIHFEKCAMIALERFIQDNVMHIDVASSADDDARLKDDEPMASSDGLAASTVDKGHAFLPDVVISLVYEKIQFHASCLESYKKLRDSILHIIFSNNFLFKELAKYRPKRRRQSSISSEEAAALPAVSLFDELASTHRKGSGQRKRRGPASSSNSSSSSTSKAIGQAVPASSSVSTRLSRRDRDRDAFNKLISQESLSS